MKKFIAIATPILALSWLVVLFLIPSNACTEYGISFFTAFFKNEGGFWGFLFSPFVALIISSIASLVTLISAFTDSKSLFSAVVWNGYLVLQLLIHLHNFYGVSEYSGLSSNLYFIYTGVLSGLFALLTVVYILRSRMERKAEKDESALAVQLVSATVETSDDKE